MLIFLEKTDSNHPNYKALVAELDIVLKAIDGEEHSFYAQYNKSDEIKHVILAYTGEAAIGCGAIKKYDENTVEVKRMYVVPSSREIGVATFILKELEGWAREMGFAEAILETGKNTPGAVKLYKKNGFEVTDSYGQYIGKELSVCMRKTISLQF